MFIFVKAHPCTVDLILLPTVKFLSSWSHTAIILLFSDSFFRLWKQWWAAPSQQQPTLLLYKHYNLQLFADIFDFSLLGSFYAEFNKGCSNFSLKRWWWYSVSGSGRLVLQQKTSVWPLCDVQKEECVSFGAFPLLCDDWAAQLALPGLILLVLRRCSASSSGDVKEAAKKKKKQTTMQLLMVESALRFHVLSLS